MSGFQRKHIDPIRRDGNTWRSGPSSSADVYSSKEAKKHLNAVHEYADRSRNKELLLKVMKAEMELARIRIAEKLESFRKEYVYRK